jgi:predicted metalloprotease with PDZ domain
MENIFVLYDRATDSIWYPGETETMNAVAGSRKGAQIDILDEPAPVPLGEWLSANPDSLVLLPSAEDLAARNRAYLGVRSENDDDAVRITSVGEETPAAKAGVLVGDLLFGINEHLITSREELRATLSEFTAGDTATLVVERGEETLELEIQFERR